jgi:hypothetical protein
MRPNLLICSGTLLALVASRQAWVSILRAPRALPHVRKVAGPAAEDHAAAHRRIADGR